ncbi:MAG: hypothetical protein AAGA87_11935 [Pseudomonadota bacterium]
MSLAALISQYYWLEQSLRRHLRESAPPDQSVEYLRLSADFLEGIEQYVPADRGEARDQVFFFMSRAIRYQGINIDGRDVNLALTLASRTDETLQEPDPETIVTGPIVTRDAGIEGPFQTIASVIQSPHRTTLLDENKRFIATSTSNAKVYGTRQSRLVGVEMSEMMPRQTYDLIARPYLDACLGGIDQDYPYRIKTPNETRLLHCKMRLIELGQDFPAILATYEDITADVSPETMGGFDVPTVVNFA